MFDVVVTGAAGFLGSALLRTLHARGLRCAGVSRRAAPGVHAVSDYRDTPPGRTLVHLAQDNDRARVAAGGSAAVDADLGLLDALLAKGYGRVVYASSAVLYGDASAVPHGTADPVHANDPYARLKLASEQRVLAAAGAVSRLTNLYGAGMAGGTVLSTILRQIPGTGPVAVMDDTPIRDFLHVDDAAAALAALAASDAGGIVNVGSGRGTSVRALAETALRIAGQQDRPVTATGGTTRRSALVVDIRETTARLGWQPAIALEDGLAGLLGVDARVRA